MERTLKLSVAEELVVAVNPDAPGFAISVRPRNGKLADREPTQAEIKEWAEWIMSNMFQLASSC